MTDAASLLHETATYCRSGDEKRPSLVGLPDITTEQVCPEDLSETVPEVDNAYPDGWYVRIMFDELLNPEIETLTEIMDPETGEPTDTYIGSIAGTKPVKLECESVNGGMVNVDYDGYYSPSGNRVTWPVGPSLVIKPNDPTLVATGSACQVTINDNVVDKSGNQVEASQKGPYKFAVAPITLLGTTPGDDPDGEAPVDAATLFSGVSFEFNTAIDTTSLCDEGTNSNECEFTFSPLTFGTCSTTTATVCETAMNGTDCPVGERCVSIKATPSATSETTVAFGPTRPLEVEQDYTLTWTAGTKIADRCGKETTFDADTAESMSVHASTNAFKLKAMSIASGETASPMKKLTLPASNMVLAASLEASEFSITPAVTGATVTVVRNSFIFGGFFNINTEYTFTLNAGATIEDAYGEVYTNPSTVTVKWKTQPAIQAAFTANDATLTKSTPTSAVGPSLSFNAPMKVAGELTEGTEYTVTDSAGANVTGFAVSATDCLATSTTCTIGIKKDLPPGAYKFTLKAGATLTDQLNNTYTQAADKVINFTVANATSTPAPACL